MTDKATWKGEVKGHYAIGGRRAVGSMRIKREIPLKDARIPSRKVLQNGNAFAKPGR